MKARADQQLKEYFFVLWYRSYYKREQLKPWEKVATKFYGKTLMRRCLRRLYNNRTMGILKKNMQDTADKYHNDNLQKQVFEQLQVNMYK